MTFERNGYVVNDDLSVTHPDGSITSPLYCVSCNIALLPEIPGHGESGISYVPHSQDVCIRLLALRLGSIEKLVRKDNS